ncbi:FecR domain-containing protein [Sphingomonas sp.]|uniref:FecR family protein n=1 Tax=Sphingomonas sp. TaxID=28214 RepID=UPI0035BC1F19
MADGERQRENEALVWVARLHDPAFAEWDAHIAWLEADPLHAAALDRAEVRMEDATAGLGSARVMPIEAANDNPAVPATRGRGVLGAAAALAAAVVGAVLVTPGEQSEPPQRIVAQTQAGEHRTITLADGTTVALNGDTAISLTRGDARQVTVDRGEAFFTVVHDAARPFRVAVGDAVIQDVGTAFNVVSAQGDVEIAVRDGAVDYDADRTPVRVAAGKRLRVGDGLAVTMPVDRSAVGGWRSGRLTYRDTAMTQVARDVARSIGEPVAVSPEVRMRRFTGVIAVNTNHRAMFERIGAVAGVRATHSSAGWRIAAGSQ